MSKLKNKIILILFAALVVLGGIFFLTRRSTSSTQSTILPTQVPVPVNTIIIQNFAFNPETLTVKQGAAVTWINEDTAVHTIKSETFNSQDLKQGDKFEITFSNKGSFDYTCGIHPTMKGKIVVE